MVAPLRRRRAGRAAGHPTARLAVEFHPCRRSQSGIPVDPPYGASINYWLERAPDGDVKIHIVNAAGDTDRTMKGEKEAGINRVWWDLQTDSITQMRSRTKPLYSDRARLPDDMNRVAGMVNRVERMRRQLEELKAMVTPGQ